MAWNRVFPGAGLLSQLGVYDLTLMLDMFCDPGHCSWRVAMLAKWTVDCRGLIHAMRRRRV